MKINVSNSSRVLQKNPSFGMALHMNKFKMFLSLGQDLTNQAENIRPNLGKMAETADVFVDSGKVTELEYLRNGVYKGSKGLCNSFIK